MKKGKKIFLAVTAAVVLLLIAAVIIGAAVIDDKPQEIIDYVLGIGEEPKDGDVNGDGKVDIFDAWLLLEQEWTDNSYVTVLKLDDDSYSLNFEKEVFEYTVTIPEGHPAVPQVSAKIINGIKVEVQQAFIPNGETKDLYL